MNYWYASDYQKIIKMEVLAWLIHYETKILFFTFFFTFLDPQNFCGDKAATADLLV